MLASPALASRVTAEVISPPGEGPTVAADAKLIDTRFGQMEVAPSSIIYFASGLLGFAHARQFVVVPFEDPKYQLFRILQCVNDPTLSFIVLPPAPEATLIDPVDLEAAAAALGYQHEELVLLLLVTVRKGAEGHALSVNLRAPILIDAAKFRGAQYVMANERYPVRLPL